ncbi:unnamed protein product [Rhodiola kirilowii]
MQSPCVVASEYLTTSLRHKFLGFHFRPALPVPSPIPAAKRRSSSNGRRNVWSIDNEMAEKEGKGESRKKRGTRVKSVRKRSGDGKVVVSGAMLVEIETVLQTQEPVVKPSWTTFASSVSGIWKGVGAVFSPVTAEMEPVDVGSKSEYLYDCYTYSRIVPVPATSGGNVAKIQRVINWVTLNPFGELQKRNGKGGMGAGEFKDGVVSDVSNNVMPTYESYDFAKSDVMEEDIMVMEPGLVYFEDGSYSRGPVEIPVGEAHDSNIPPTFKFEQVTFSVIDARDLCLVSGKGCHRRLRIVHTIDFNNGGADIQIMRVAVYEEEWDSPANMDDQSGREFDLKPFSQRKRTQPSQLTGPWKVFEVSATPIFGADASTDERNGSDIPYVYLCNENNEEKKKEFYALELAWYSDEGINLVMERDYGTDGKLKEVRWKSEVKRRWSDPMQV